MVSRNSRACVIAEEHRSRVVVIVLHQGGLEEDFKFTRATRAATASPEPNEAINRGRIRGCGLAHYAFWIQIQGPGQALSDAPFWVSLALDAISAGQMGFWSTAPEGHSSRSVRVVFRSSVCARSWCRCPARARRCDGQAHYHRYVERLITRQARRPIAWATACDAMLTQHVASGCQVSLVLDFGSSCALCRINTIFVMTVGNVVCRARPRRARLPSSKDGGKVMMGMSESHVITANLGAGSVKKPPATTRRLVVSLGFR